MKEDKIISKVNDKIMNWSNLPTAPPLSETQILFCVYFHKLPSCFTAELGSKYNRSQDTMAADSNNFYLNGSETLGTATIFMYCYDKLLVLKA